MAEDKSDAVRRDRCAHGVAEFEAASATGRADA